MQTLNKLGNNEPKGTSSLRYLVDIDVIIKNPCEDARKSPSN